MTGTFLLSDLNVAASLYSTEAADCRGYRVGSKGIGACTN
ncbi:hypothetical protein FOXYSP1_02413 [Fusarium oxysporum f. sp. phaseoli]